MPIDQWQPIETEQGLGEQWTRHVDVSTATT